MIRGVRPDTDESAAASGSVLAKVFAGGGGSRVACGKQAAGTIDFIGR